MSFKIELGQDGILRVTLSGDLDRGIVENLRREYDPFVEAATHENPLRNLFYVEELGRLSSSARRYLTTLNSDSRYGPAAFVRPPRRVRVLGQFILKATGRKNISFFDTEDQAINWLRSQAG